MKRGEFPTLSYFYKLPVREIGVECETKGENKKLPLKWRVTHIIMDEKQASNSIIEYLKACDPELMDRVVKVFAECRKLDFMSIRQGDIMVVTPEKAFEYKGNEGDKYFKIWMAGDKIAWCTWANSMIDSRFRWNSKETDPEKQRDNADILGNEPYVSEFIKSWTARKKCTLVYMFPFAAFSGLRATSSPTVRKGGEKAPVAEKKAKPVPERTKELTKEQKVEKLVDNLSKLSTEIARNLDLDWACNDDMVDFQNNLMQLKCLDETNKMIPYFEQMSAKWPQPKKPRKGLLESAFNLIFGL